MELNSIKSAQLNGIINQYEIPESVRKDGSIRKARRVKPGFVPQEEVPLYTPKGKRERVAQSAYPPGWHPTPAPAASKSKAEKLPKPQQVNPAPNAEKIKIKVKKEASKPAPPTVEKKVEEISEKLQDKLQISGDDPTIELSKKLKRIRRKLREVEILDEKIKAGEITAPEKDQLEKISRRKMFEEEINQLEMEREKLRKLKPNKTT